MRWIVLLILSCVVVMAAAFQVAPRGATTSLLDHPSIASTTSLYVFGKKKKPKEDLSYIESRDMTREEMFELNKQNEDIMNAELLGMTIFSLVISLPLLYLAWVGFFSETSEVAGELL
jgi:hypothetical protein